MAHPSRNEILNEASVRSSCSSSNTATKLTAHFDWRYCGEDGDYRCRLPERPPATVASPDDARAWVDAFSQHKQAVDIRFLKHPKIEREYQQAVVRDNNRHASGDKPDYMIVDIEYAKSPAASPERNHNSRFHMVGPRRPVNGGSRGSGAVTPVIMEMKTGDAALAAHPTSPEGKDLSPGLARHVRYVESFPASDPGSATPISTGTPMRTRAQRLRRSG